MTWKNINLNNSYYICAYKIPKKKCRAFWNSACPALKQIDLGMFWKRSQQPPVIVIAAS